MDSLPNYPSYGAPLTSALSRARGGSAIIQIIQIFNFSVSFVACDDPCLSRRRSSDVMFYLSEARGRTFHDLNSPSLIRLMKSSTSGLGLNHCEIASSPLQRWVLFLNSILNPIQPPHLSNLEPHHPIHLLICVLSLDLIRWLSTSLKFDCLIQQQQHLIRLYGRLTLYFVLLQQPLLFLATGVPKIPFSSSHV